MLKRFEIKLPSDHPVAAMNPGQRGKIIEEMFFGYRYLKEILACYRETLQVLSEVKVMQGKLAQELNEIKNMLSTGEKHVEKIENNTLLKDSKKMKKFSNSILNSFE